MKTWNDYKNYVRAESLELRKDIDEAEVLSGIFKMSIWSYVCGVMEVEVFGNTQAQCTYMLQTVIDHMPKIYGSEGPCDIYIVQRKDRTVSSDFDEFGHKIEKRNIYMLVLEGDLRHTNFQKTYRRVVKWLCRLAKRVHVLDVLLKVEDTCRQKIRIITNKNEYWGSLYENGGPTDEDMNWCQYLLPVSKLNEMPALLAYKYYGENEELAKMVDNCTRRRKDE